MKVFEKDMSMVIQGDVAFVRISEDEIPNNAKRITAATGQYTVVAHSETGHDHAFDASPNVCVLDDPDNDFVSYLQINNGDADLEHHRDIDTHETIKFTPGTYRIHRQREHTPEGWRRVAD